MQDEDESEEAQEQAPQRSVRFTDTAQVQTENTGEEEVFEDSYELFSEPEPPRFIVTKHPHTQRKCIDWNLVVRKKWLIIGDSNLSNLPPFFCKDLQIDSYPGAHFRHAQALVEKSRPVQGLVVEKVVLSFGINSRANKSRETTVKNLQGALRSTKRKFPYAQIWIPMVNYSSDLPEDERENLQILNEHIERNMPFIPPLPQERFGTELDDIHWTYETGKAINSGKYKHIPFSGPSIWVPSEELLPQEVKTLMEKDKRDLQVHYRKHQEKENLTQPEVQALRDLQNMKHLVIKPADKGSAIVVLSREQYIFEVERQLNDTRYYKKLKKPLYRETIPIVIEIINKLKKEKYINEKQRQYLIGNLEPRERRFYILPKIHKDKKDWTVPFQIPPGRPIVSDSMSETYFTAEYIDFFLNPLSIKHPAYVKDTYHFVEMVHNLILPPKFNFFSMDVDNLYTNIPISAGIDCIKNIFQEYPDPKRPDEALLKLLEINLEQGISKKQYRYYLRLFGIGDIPDPS
ncbi:hypothetical protein CCH79_00019464 [Gambusia affinis]|uniref:Reverse transcriptase domain-containing protein n=1 Tax=Gambusia affinis TaxID=33528 RepID=A0A315W015_GAMAF|nr:hypothetical protein CCH79_00019464 [Gambusia affinis]